MTSLMRLRSLFGVAETGAERMMKGCSNWGNIIYLPLTEYT